jgi:rod shape-determining protein MreD
MIGDLPRGRRHDVRMVVPALVTLTLVFVAYVPTGSPTLSLAAPMFSVMSVYYWSVYRPDLMPLWVAFLAGLCQDALGSAPFGMMAVVMVLAGGIATARRRLFANRSFWVGWLGFVMVAAAACAAVWAISSFVASTFLDLRLALLQLAVAAAVYPALAWMLLRAERWLPDPA